MARKSKVPSAPGSWQSRIVGYGEEDADQLLAHPSNWRLHPQNQQELMSDILTEVGWVGEVMVNKRTGRVVDGHLRVLIALERGEKVPVRYVDLSEQEEEKVLATFDPVAALAFRDDANYRKVLEGIEAEEAALKAFIQQQKGEDSELTNVPQSPVDLIGRDTRPGHGNGEAGDTDDIPNEGSWQVLSFLLPEGDYRFVQNTLEGIKAKTGVFGDHEAIVVLCRGYTGAKEEEDDGEE